MLNEEEHTRTHTRARASLVLRPATEPPAAHSEGADTQLTLSGTAEPGCSSDAEATPDAPRSLLSSTFSVVFSCLGFDANIKPSEFLSAQMGSLRWELRWDTDVNI